LANINHVEAKRKEPRKDLLCPVCVVLVDETIAGINRTEETHSVQTKWRIDEKKNALKIPYAYSEYRLMEIIEKDVERSLKDYALSSQGDVHLLVKLSGGNVSVNNVTMSEDITKEIKWIYENFVSDSEEDIVLVFHRNIGLSWSDYRTKVCQNLLKVCTEAHLISLPPPLKLQETEPSLPPSSTDSVKTEGEIQNEENEESASLPEPRPVLPPLQVEL